VRRSKVIVSWTALLVLFVFTPVFSPDAAAAGAAAAATRVPLRVERAQADVPVTFGIPMPKGALDNPDHVRVLDSSQREIPSQITDVSTWEPLDPSIKWIWVFFFTTSSSREYILEFGPNVHRAPLTGPKISMVNNQRPGGGIDVTTGPLKFSVRKGNGSGFLDSVYVDADGQGFGEDDLMAVAPADGRGSFLDLVNDSGPDASKAWVRRTTMERGSGPLHAIIRVDGEYRYSKPGHAPAPFVTRIHAYAGRSYITVDHTFVFTGDPDKHKKAEGEHEHIATQTEKIIPEIANDPGWMQPNDRLSAAGLAVELKSAPGVKLRATSAMGAGRWWEDKDAAPIDAAVEKSSALLQTGPKPNRIPPVPESSATARLEQGFEAALTVDGRQVANGERAPGWMVIGDGAREIAIAMPRFLEEYPKEIRYEAGRATAFFWSPAVEPMSFARFSSDLDREEETVAIENNAQGMAKTSEAIFDFRRAGAAASERAPLNAFRHPPVAHADPAWYGQSGVFGIFAARSERYPEFQRALDYKFEWMLFNQRWAPWFGMWDYGDWKLYFDGGRWIQWGNNEPAGDFTNWMQFMRTGDPRVYDAARANSRHSMDVDNVHWPADPVWLGDSNVSLDYFNFLKEPKGTTKLGIGSRHANQHWVRTLTAHVWVQGWMADYLLAADHRALDVARQTADMHLKRLWGEHGLTGRRLYLALWNVIEVWDATKDERYWKEIEDLAARVLRLAENDQGGSLVLDRYGYADVYVSHSLAKYYQMTGDRRVAAALARHARRVRDVPPLNHEMESYLSSVYSLVLGYELTGEPSLLAEIRHRMEVLKVDKLSKPFDAGWTQAALGEALEGVSHLPKQSSSRFRSKPIWSISNGFRVFGWTHAYTLPYALDLLDRVEQKESDQKRGDPRDGTRAGR
jgi:hypothetical protein